MKHAVVRNSGLLLTMHLVYFSVHLNLSTWVLLHLALIGSSATSQSAELPRLALTEWPVCVCGAQLLCLYLSVALLFEMISWLASPSFKSTPSVLEDSVITPTLHDHESHSMILNICGVDHGVRITPWSNRRYG